MRLRALARCVLVLVLAGTISAPAAARQVSAGVHGAWATDYDFGIGGRVILDLGTLLEGLETAAGLDAFFPGPDLGVDLTYWEANADFIYRFGSDAALTPYAGTGFHRARLGASTDALGVELSGGETKVGLNVLGGFRFRFRSVRPFVEGRLELGGGDQFVIAAGIRR